MLQTRTAVPAHGEDAQYLPLLSPIHSQLSNEYSLDDFKTEVLAKLSRRMEWSHCGDYLDLSVKATRFLCGCPARRNRRSAVYAESVPTDPHYRINSATLELRHRDHKCQGGVILTLSIDELPLALRICILR